MKKFPRTPHIKGSKGTPDDIFESKYLSIPTYTIL